MNDTIQKPSINKNALDIFTAGAELDFQENHYIKYRKAYDEKMRIKKLPKKKYH